jgi:glycosyltransferase involved in cell wall biosynthesis
MENGSLSYCPKITIVTPSLNQGQFIDATIRSVLSQGYPNLEYIIMDGGSTDNTLDVLRSHTDQVKWFSEKDEGQTHAINKGLYMARGEILAYLNADDLLLPGTLYKVAEVFMKNRDAAWVTGRCRIIDENDLETRKLITIYKNLLLRLHHPSLLFITDYVSQPATFWCANVFKELGPLDENLHYAMDYEYWLRLNAKFPLVVLPDYLAAFRVHRQSKNINAGHGSIYIAEEKDIIQRYTNSKSLLFLHHIHRWIMTKTYSILNSEAG